MEIEGFTKKSAMWYELIVPQAHEGRILTAEVHVPPGSPWFDGHFPGAPVLPGIAQLGMVFDLIRHAFEGPIWVAEVSRVRFKQIILPDDRLSVSAEPRPGRIGTYAFRIAKGEDLVCSGTMVVEAGDKPENRSGPKET
jgi:3-hydroxyacyl-[acyl-carrier-protein] dehydratase